MILDKNTQVSISLYNDCSKGQVDVPFQQYCIDFPWKSMWSWFHFETGTYCIQCWKFRYIYCVDIRDNENKSKSQQISVFVFAIFILEHFQV